MHAAVRIEMLIFYKEKYVAKRSRDFRILKIARLSRKQFPYEPAFAIKNSVFANGSKAGQVCVSAFGEKDGRNNLQRKEHHDRNQSQKRPAEDQCPPA